MPFIKKADSQGSQPPTDASKIFIGRTGELLFFKQNILMPEEPPHNIVSIWGQGGVGKSTLLARLIDEAHSAEFKDYCLTAIVDERQTTPTSLMEQFAEQLHIAGKFEKALRQYKEALRKLQGEPDTPQDTFSQRAPDFAGAATEVIPFVGPLAREGVKVVAGHLLDTYHTVQAGKDKERLENSIEDLTRAFVLELNQLTDTRVSLRAQRVKRQRRVILFFDTFEQLSLEAAPWLLDHFLQADISNQVILVVAGRDPIERSTPVDPKRWLPYLDDGTIYSISLDSFTEEETRAYLAQRGITDPTRIDTTWQLSRGLPLYLSLLTSNPQGNVDPTKDVVDNFLRWIPQQEQIKRRLVLDTALLSKPFNQDDLEAFAYLPEHERNSIYDWLIGLPFVRSSSEDGRYNYHELAQELFSRHLYQRSRNVYYATRRVLADHYQRLLSKIQEEGNEQLYRSSEWLELALAPVYQWFFLPDEASHVKATEQLLSTYRHTNKEQDQEIVRVLRKLSEEQTTKQANPAAIRLVKQLLRFIETDQDSQETLVAASSLLQELIQKSLFPQALLALIFSKRGNAYGSFKNYQQAFADFERALELDPDYAFAYRSRGWAYYWLKDYQLAFADFNRALELDPIDPYGYHSRGWAYDALKNYRQAIADFDRAVELDPNFSWSYCGRGWVYDDLKEYQQAIVDFNYALELEPNYTYAYIGRGWAYYWLKDYQLAFADFNRALELDPNYIRAYHARGWACGHLKNYQQAIADFDHALELDPNYFRAYCGRGWVYHQLKDYQQAIVDFDHALELVPNDAWTYRLRGYTYLWLKDIQQAKADFTKSWELDPSDIRNGWMMKWTEMCLDRCAPSTAEWLDKIVAIDPRLYTTYVCRGTAQYLSKHFEEALAELEQAIQLEPEEWPAYFWKGMACASLDWDKDAIAAIEKALELGLPPVLLAPLCWFERDRPKFFEKYANPLLARFEQACIQMLSC
jgi:tetratricopeptide (TPR) repeat protein